MVLLLHFFSDRAPTLIFSHGSCAAKACLPATFSTVIYIFMYYYTDGPASEDKWKDFNLLIHPYPVTVVVATFTVGIEPLVRKYVNYYE